MRYHFELVNLPFEFKPFEVQIPYDRNGLTYIEVAVPLSETKNFNPKFLNWAQEHGVEPTHCRYFESSPEFITNMHRDSTSLENNDKPLIKFNFIFDSYNSEMNWYRTNDGYDGYIYKNDVDESILGFSEKECMRIYNAPTNTHCMFSAGIIHDLRNGKNNGVWRKVYSYLVPLSWDEAVNRFDYFLKY